MLDNRHCVQTSGKKSQKNLALKHQEVIFTAPSGQTLKVMFSLSLICMNWLPLALIPILADETYILGCVMGSCCGGNNVAAGPINLSNQGNY